ncbi:MAG: 16S rRNA (guanine(966)-N(2))-methyltransferase RsmD [Pseudomonadota bacterium]
MRAARTNQVRIIGGALRRRHLRFPDLPGLRPTPDRVRETLFNWLGQDLHGLHCLDAFAGSGALGFEAASRGAARVLMLERDAQALAALRGNAKILEIGNVEILGADAMGFLAAPGDAFDVIFLDPPFASQQIVPALRAAATHLRPDGRIYAESGAPLPEAELAAAGLGVLRQGRAGHSHYWLLERS